MPRKIQLEIRQKITDKAETLSALFASNMFHWHPEYRVLINGEPVTSWGRIEDAKELAAEARASGHKLFPDQIRKVLYGVNKRMREDAAKEAAAKYRAECKKKGVAVNQKQLKKVKRKSFPGHLWWYGSSGGMTNTKHKPVIIG